MKKRFMIMLLLGLVLLFVGGGMVMASAMQTNTETYENSFFAERQTALVTHYDESSNYIEPFSTPGISSLDHVGIDINRSLRSQNIIPQYGEFLFDLRPGDILHEIRGGAGNGLLQL